MKRYRVTGGPFVAIGAIEVEAESPEAASKAALARVQVVTDQRLYGPPGMALPVTEICDDGPTIAALPGQA
jgi:hypothetical protein